MKKSNKGSLVVWAIALVLIVIALILWQTGGFNKIASTGNSQLAALGAVPPLGTLESFSILAALSMSSANTTTVSANLGLSPGLASSKTGTWVHTGGSDYFGTGDVSAAAQADALAAYNNLVAQTTSGVWSTDPVGGQDAPEPGVWTETGSPAYSSTLTLTGTASDVWVFQISTDFTFDGAVTLAGNASACNVFWAVAGDATITTGTPFVGTLIASGNITSATNSTINGRLISLNGYIHMDGADSSISGCGAGTVPGGSSFQYPTEGTINVVKSVINDSGGSKTVADFPLFVSGKPVISGVTNTFHAPFYPYAITETPNSNYVQTFSGDCDSKGLINLNPKDIKFCIITNDDIGPSINPPVPPLIDVVKVPSPLALPKGPGPVTYTYTLRNTGTVPVTDVTMVGDTCSPITFVSGDTNSDSKLDLNEVWKYRCSTILSATHTNVITATGWANGVSAVDVANATVVVGDPTVPPIIHVTKVPSPLKLTIGGGTVTYTEKIDNPGTVALSNVKLTDDKCSPMKYISGDTNGDSKLDTTETWTYTCKTNLTKTTTNVAIASGEANGLTARDLAVATVIVSVTIPGLPNTGFAPQGER